MVQQPGPYRPNLKTAKKDADRFDQRMADEKALTLARRETIRKARIEKARK